MVLSASSNRSSAPASKCELAPRAEMRIGDSLILVSDGGGARETRETFLYVYVENTDKIYRRVLEGGALSIENRVDTPYGDRRATVQDPWGNTWQIATHADALAS